MLPEDIRDQYQNAQAIGTVKAVGPEAWADKSTRWAEVGDRVVFDKYKGIVVDGHEDTYRLLNDTDVLAVVDEGIKVGHLERRTKYER